MKSLYACSAAACSVGFVDSSISLSCVKRSISPTPYFIVSASLSACYDLRRESTSYIVSLASFTSSFSHGPCAATRLKMSVDKVRFIIYLFVWSFKILLFSNNQIKLYKTMQFWVL